MRTPSLLLAGLSLMAFAPQALADFYFSSPVGGQSYPGGTALKVTFVDNGKAPAVADLTTYTLSVCYGGNTAASYECKVLTTGGTFTTLSASVTIPLTTGASKTNAYFMKMVSTSSTGGTVTDFSDRFSLTGMTGTFSTAVTQGLAQVSGDSGPIGINTFTQASTASSVPEAGLFTVPFHLQTGLVKYAPMQPVPPTKITAKTASRMNPTSAYSIATTYLAPPSVTLTVTNSQTFSVSSAENTIAAAQTRTKDDMGNWLRRWAD
ncbi:hypothetical protein AAFC00_004420 [Neodothiora populina]